MSYDNSTFPGTGGITSPDWLNKGDNAWQLTAASLVCLQSIPGLVVLYGGWVKHKWAVNSAFMAFYAFAAVLICWMVWAYKESFGHQMLPFVGTPGPAVEMDFELKQSVLPAAGLLQLYPQSTMIYFQFAFAAITLILTAGSYLCRMNFFAWMLFVPLWLTFSYAIGAFSIWGGGFLYKLGVIDYSGGYVIHLSSGTAGFVGAWWIGPRIEEDLDDATPNNILVMLVGAGLLWIGWNGFNGGDPYAASPDAGAAVLNTNLCTAVSCLVWVFMDLWYYRRPSVIGAIQGMITGLVAITPAAGVVAGWGAVILGVGSGTIPWLSLNLGKRYIWLFQHVDDCLDVFHTHFVGAIVGGFGTGLFATTEGCLAFGITNPGGAIDGNGRQVWVQIVGALFIIGWNIVWTSLIMMFIKYVLRVPLRMSDEACKIGDFAVHQEESYTFAYYNRKLLPHDMEALSKRQDDLEAGLTGRVITGQEPKTTEASSGSSAEAHRDSIQHLSPKERMEINREKRAEAKQD